MDWWHMQWRPLVTACHSNQLLGRDDPAKPDVKQPTSWICSCRGIMMAYLKVRPVRLRFLNRIWGQTWHCELQLNNKTSYHKAGWGVKGSSFQRANRLNKDVTDVMLQLCASLPRHKVPGERQAAKHSLVPNQRGQVGQVIRGYQRLMERHDRRDPSGTFDKNTWRGARAWTWQVERTLASLAARRSNMFKRGFVVFFVVLLRFWWLRLGVVRLTHRL